MTQPPTVIEPQRDSSDGGIFSTLTPLGRVSMNYYFRFLDAWAVWRDTGNRISYETTANRLRISGESEYVGDRVHRVRNLYLSMTLHTFAWMMVGMYAMLGSGEVGTSTPASALVSLALALIAAGSAGMAMAGVEAFQRCEIVDYTTEPTPEMDDLTQQYVDGEIDTETLEAETEARLE